MKYIVGIDVGGTNVRVALYQEKDSSYIALSCNKFISCANTAEEIDVNIIIPICEMIKSNDVSMEEILGLTVAMAAGFDRSSGDIIAWGNHPNWNGFAFKTYLKKHIDKKIIIEDDANCAAIYEYNQLCKNSSMSIVYITISTGVGSGIILEGNLYSGKGRAAGELGHIKVNNNSRLCTCGEHGCLQSLLSGEGIRKTIVEKHFEKGIDVSDIYNLENMVSDVRCKSSVIDEILLDKAVLTGDVIVSLSRIIGIKHFIVGGGVISGIPKFSPLIKREVKKIDPAIVILEAKNNKYNGVFGAIQNFRIQRRYR